MLKRILIKKDQREFFVRENLKYEIVIKNVIVSEDTLMQKAEHPSIFFQLFHT